MGHDPGPDALARMSMDEHARNLFRAFQSNLLSLISHELRTPLMGVINALSLLEQNQAEPGAAGLSTAELTAMARRNALRLQQTLASLLDLASIESGSFRAQPREVDLERLIQARIELQRSVLEEVGLRAEVSSKPSEDTQQFLVDPQKLGRAMDLLIQALSTRAERGSTLEFRVVSFRLEVSAVLAEGRESSWQAAWSQGLAGFQGGVVSPLSAFSGVLQSETAFLTRSEEGLGNELMLVHEILRLHEGRFEAEQKGRSVMLSLVFPHLSDRERLERVLRSRTERVEPGSGAVGSVTLALISAPAGTSAQDFCAQVRAKLFRASDSAYPLEGCVALVIEDCKPEDGPALLERILAALAPSARLDTALVSAPRDGVDAELLVSLALARLKG